MYPVKVKDYTRLGGWLALITVLCAMRGTSGLLSWLVNWEVNAYVWAPLPLLGAATSCAMLVAFGLLLARKRAARYVFPAATGAEALIVLCVMLFGGIWGAPVSVLAELFISLLQQILFCVAGSVYLFRSRRVAVYFGEAQPMWYECGQPGPCGAQPPYGAPGQPPYGYGPQGAAQPPYSYGPQGPGAQPVPPQGAYAPPAAPQPPQAPPQQAAAPFAYQPQAAQSSVPPARPAPTQATPAQPGAGAMVCPACGMQGAPGASFCTVCGAHLVPAAQAPAQPKEGEPHV